MLRSSKSQPILKLKFSITEYYNVYWSNTDDEGWKDFAKAVECIFFLSLQK